MFTKRELENMLNDLNWSGTEGLKIRTQKKLVEMTLGLLKEKLELSEKQND